MAESGKITREDIIAKDAFTSAVDEAKQLLDVINQISNALKTKAKSTADGFAIASPQSIEDVKKLTDQIAELKKQIAALEAVTEKQKKAQKELTAAQAEENLARQKQRQEVMQQVKITSELTTEYEKQVVRLAQVKKELKDLSVQGVKAPQSLVDEFTKLDTSVRKAEEGVKEFQRSVGNYASATAELKDLTRQLLELEKAGKRNTDEFKNLRARAAELKDTISDVKAEVKALASDTRTIDGVVGSVNLLANGFQVAEGALVLLGKDSKEWQETMIRLQAIMAVTNGLQDIQNALQKESSAMLFLSNLRTKALAATQSIYAFATGGATTATNAFRISLVALTGLGIIALLVGIATQMDLFSDATDEATEAQKRFNEEQNKLAQSEQSVRNRYEARKRLSREQLEQLKSDIVQEKDAIEKANAEIVGKNERRRIDEGEQIKRRAKEIKDTETDLNKFRHLYSKEDQVIIQQKIDLLKKENENAIKNLNALKDDNPELEYKKKQIIEIDKLLKDEESKVKRSAKKEAEEKMKAIDAYYSYYKEKLDDLGNLEKKRRDDLDKANQARLKDDVVRNQLDQEKRQGLIDGYAEQTDALKDATKKDYDLIKTGLDIEYRARQKKLDKQKDFEISNKDLTDNEKLLIEEKYKNDSLALAREKAAELKGINQQELDDKKKNEEAKLAAERKVQKQVLQGIEQGTKRRSEIIQNGLNAEIKKQDEAVQRQQELAAKGLDNTLAYQEKKREELQAKLEREREAERKREEALQLAGAFLGSYQRRLDDKQKSPQALAGALADTLIAKAISSTIAGAFAEGVENFQGKGTGTSDSNLIAFSHGESVVTAKATQQYSGLVTAMNKGLVDDYVRQMILPNMDEAPKANSSSFQSAAIVYTLTKELGELKQAIKNKQEIKVNWNAQGERVEEIVKDGMKTVIKHVTTGKRRL